MGVGSDGGDLGPELTRIVKTGDGGQHWTRVYSSAFGIGTLACANADSCDSVGSDTALRTTNGGQTWIEP